MLYKFSEKLLESKLRKEIKKLGGLCIKFTYPYFTGMPDRMVLMPDGRTYFVELKSTGGRLSSRQEVVHSTLKDLGHEVRIIDSNKTLSAFVEWVWVCGF